MTTNDDKELEKILTALENAVALNVQSQGMRSEAPKQSHSKAKQRLFRWRDREVVKARKDEITWSMDTWGMSDSDEVFWGLMRKRENELKATLKEEQLNKEEK